MLIVTARLVRPHEIGSEPKAVLQAGKKWSSYVQKNATAQDEQRRSSRCKLTHLSSNQLSHPSDDPVTLPSAASLIARRRFVERVGVVGLIDVGEMVR